MRQNRHRSFIHSGQKITEIAQIVPMITEIEPPITEITPSRHGPLSAATGGFAVGLAFGAAFLATGFACGAD